MNFGLEPVYNKESKILILGSFPSVKSRNVQFYYGNPQNRFWKMLQDVFKIDFNVSSSKKIENLHKLNIALWDIVKNSNIKGSSDLNLIKNITQNDINDIDGLIAKTKIKKILCNGKASYNLCCKYVKSDVEIVYVPSTSPACVKFNQSKWEEELKNIWKN